METLLEIVEEHQGIIIGWLLGSLSIFIGFYREWRQRNRDYWNSRLEKIGQWVDENLKYMNPYLTLSADRREEALHSEKAIEASANLSALDMRNVAYATRINRLELIELCDKFILQRNDFYSNIVNIPKDTTLSREQIYNQIVPIKAIAIDIHRIIDKLWKM